MSNETSKGGFFSRWGRRITRARNFVLNAAFVLFFVVLLSTLLIRPGQLEIEPNSALFIVPTGTLVEQVTPPSNWQEVLFSSSEMGLIEVKDLLDSIDLAAQDDRITTLVMKLDELGGLTSSRAIRIGEHLKAFRETGKEVIAYTEYSGQFQYLANSYADHIFMHPMGNIMLTGLGGDRLYYADLLEKLKIKMHIFRVGEYKSAVEPFTRNNMSPAARSDSQQLLDGIWQHIVAAIAENRELNESTVLDFADNFDRLLAETKGDVAQATLDNGMVDGLMTTSEFRKEIGDRVGWQEDVLNGIDFQYYLAEQQGGALDNSEGNTDIVGVIAVQGAIVESGVGGSDMASADALVDQIRAAKDDDRIKALVLRVNSPGGSAFASELIREELVTFQETGKPVVASFGPVSASGGYWVSASADAIFAEPTTVTGSIGIFGVVPNFSQSLGELGIYADGTSSAPLARGFSVIGELSEQAQRILQLSIDHGYAQFIELVAQGRNMQRGDVENIAQGRVWSGASAKDIGLVDELGGLEDAIAHAAELAELENWSSEQVRPPLDPRSMLLMELMQVTTPAQTTQWIDKKVQQLPWLSRLSQDLKPLKAFTDPRHVYAMCLGCSSH